MVSQCRKLRFHEFYEIKHETLAYSYICGLNTYPPSMLNAKHAKFQVKSGRRRGRLFDLVIRDYLKKKKNKSRYNSRLLLRKRRLKTATKQHLVLGVSRLFFSRKKIKPL